MTERLLKVNGSIFADMVSTGSCIFRHPIDAVWPHLLDQASWMKDVKLETIDGQRNQVGEVKRATPPEARYHPFFFRTLLLIPLRKFVYKAYTENRAGKYGFTGIEVLSLRDLGKDSAVVFEAYLEFQTWTMTRDELADYIEHVKKGSAAMWEGNFARLSALVDGAGA
jgi:hypothetical protein